jgi:multiple sugar transport system ATP-binding protein
MPTITFDAVSKSYDSTRVIHKFNATIPDRDFLVLLGPSGCGKSTMLRMIAGLTDITGGRLLFDDRVMNNLSPKRRNIAFVFQSYALYPHMTVRANIAFPLIMDSFRWWHHVPVVGTIIRRRLLKRDDIATKVAEVAGMLELTDYLDRRPRALSGGQRQRVALARALVREPSVYLLDEPLSNLDAKLRTQMRAELTALHARVQKTFIYVTHDQVEAMTMGTRIIVLDNGVVQQYGTPKDIYDSPANVFVAKFIGAPPMNLIEVAVHPDGLVMAGDRVPGSDAIAAALHDHGRANVLLGIRAEKMRATSVRRDEPGTFAGHVSAVEHLGAETILGFKFGPPEGEVAIGAAATRGTHFVKLPGDVPFILGAACWIDFTLADAVWFDPDSGERLDVGAVQPVPENA